ncbi:phage tail protein [Pseudovibrio sp. Tun.PSC04-5.I4]|uniref:phage tail protein n=1 Tax=Pseudovibrio sp. Tun.PSC04-5.I4 TaxID=1798213 RepID=UPI00087E5D9B|nr:phage tail protein [Pseudovibrio sp. Tun.PSC04-5.I4]SDQ99932.1 hypothetical protein SAMN04515695_2245 [Pseudovibrio sp. Tun.PSC04-5.I4]
MSAPKIGMQFSYKSDDPFPVTEGDLSKVLVIDSSEDASDTEYPLDTPKRISSGDRAKVDALGTGTLRDHLRGVQDQLNLMERSADVTVVRTAKGATPEASAAAIAAIINSITEIPSAVNCTPGIVVAGSTAWRPDLETVNPVVAALEANIGRILAVAPVDVDPTSSANAIDARETMASGRLMPVGVAARVWEGDTVVTRPMASRVAGLIVRADTNNGNMPFETICNEPIFGLAGLSRKIPFNFLDGSKEGQQMLAADVAIVTEGEIGVYGSVAEGGFTFLGTDMAQTDAQWPQLHQQRGTDYIVTQMIKITRRHLGKKQSAQRVESWIREIVGDLRGLKQGGHILGYAPASQMFKADKNQPEKIELGHINLEIKQETASAFKRADFEMRRYRPAVDGLIRDILARLRSVV